LVGCSRPCGLQNPTSIDSHILVVANLNRTGFHGYGVNRESRRPASEPPRSLLVVSLLALGSQPSWRFACYPSSSRLLVARPDSIATAIALLFCSSAGGDLGAGSMAVQRPAASVPGSWNWRTITGEYCSCRGEIPAAPSSVLALGHRAGCSSCQRPVIIPSVHAPRDRRHPGAPGRMPGE
jgi:hypothetical protein